MYGPRQGSRTLPWKERGNGDSEETAIVAEVHPIKKIQKNFEKKFFP